MTMITPSYLGETIEYSSLHACRSTLEDPTEPFSFDAVDPVDGELSFSSHSIEPDAVLGMAHELFGATTRGYALGIRGYEFNAFGEQLSEKARSNLEAAVSFLEGALKHDLLEDSTGVYGVRAMSG